MPDIARELGLRVETVHGYRSRKQMPEPTGVIGRTPYWTDATIGPWIERQKARRKHKGEAEMATTISTEQATDMLRAEGYATADITAAMNSFIAADAPAEDESGEWAWTAEDLGVLRRVLGRLGRRAARAYAVGNP